MSYGVSTRALADAQMQSMQLMSERVNDIESHLDDDRFPCEFRIQYVRDSAEVVSTVVHCGDETDADRTTLCPSCHALFKGITAGDYDMVEGQRAPSLWDKAVGFVKSNPKLVALTGIALVILGSIAGYQLSKNASTSSQLLGNDLNQNATDLATTLATTAESVTPTIILSTEALAPTTTALAPTTTALAPTTTALAPTTTALAPTTTALEPTTTTPTAVPTIEPTTIKFSTIPEIMPCFEDVVLTEGARNTPHHLSLACEGKEVQLEVKSECALAASQVTLNPVQQLKFVMTKSARQNVECRYPFIEKEVSAYYPPRKGIKQVELKVNNLLGKAINATLTQHFKVGSDQLITNVQLSDSWIFISGDLTSNHKFFSVQYSGGGLEEGLKASGSNWWHYENQMVSFGDDARLDEKATDGSYVYDASKDGKAALLHTLLDFKDSGGILRHNLDVATEDNKGNLDPGVITKPMKLVVSNRWYVHSASFIYAWKINGEWQHDQSDVKIPSVYKYMERTLPKGAAGLNVQIGCSSGGELFGARYLPARPTLTAYKGDTACVEVKSSLPNHFSKDFLHGRCGR